jgi:hypothetical protein
MIRFKAPIYGMHLGATTLSYKNMLSGKFTMERCPILAGLLATIATFALNGRAMPPPPANANQESTSCKGFVEGEFSTPPLAHMEDSAS